MTYGGLLFGQSILIWWSGLDYISVVNIIRDDWFLIGGVSVLKQCIRRKLHDSFHFFNVARLYVHPVDSLVLAVASCGQLLIAVNLTLLLARFLFLRSVMHRPVPSNVLLLALLELRAFVSGAADANFVVPLVICRDRALKVF